ncbi:MAG: hypothetical protein ACI9IP_002555 [Arcticibacterium sp.]|jgi:hypothetical protein
MNKCKICKSILKGRKGKLFCSVSCKNFYHTRLREVTRKKAFAIDRHLHRNRSILLEIIGKKKTKLKVSRIILEYKMFHWKYLTHFHINSQGKRMHYVYDLGWMDFSDNEVLIVRNTPELVT